MFSTFRRNLHYITYCAQSNEQCYPALSVCYWLKFSIHIRIPADTAVSSKHMKSGVPVAKRRSWQDMDTTSKRQQCLNTETNQPEWSCSFNKQWRTGTKLVELDTGALFKHLVTRLGESKKLFYNCIWWSCPVVLLMPFDVMYLRIY